MRERRHAARLRAVRDVGLLVAIALAGAAVAIYVHPPLTRGLGCFIAAWFAALMVLVRLAVRRATGRGIVGTPEGVVRYFADPELFAFGWTYSTAAGGGLATSIVLAALVTQAR